jgi:hypothetical protein
MPDESLHDTVVAAYQKHAAEAEAPPVEVEAPAAPAQDATPAPAEATPPTDAGAIDRSRDPKGRFAKGGTAAPTATGSKTAAVPATGVGTPPVSTTPAPVATQTPAQPPATDIRPPQSWKPQAREKWSALPREVQEESIRIDREVRQVMQETAPLRKMADEFRQVVSPYEGLIRAQGVEPMQAIGGALQTFAALFTGAPQHKAQVLANLFDRSGIPIELLAEAIDGKLKQAPQGLDPNRLREEIKRDLFRDLQAQRSSYQEQQLRSELDAFANEGHEFFDNESVQARMTSILNADRNVSLKDAYEQACWSVGDVRKVLQQRESAKAAETAQAATRRTMAAASSVKSQPASPVNGTSATDLKSRIRASIASLQER